MKTFVYLLAALYGQTLLAAQPLGFEEAQRLAEQAAPQLEVASAQESAARDMAHAARQLPDPVLKMGVSNLPVSGDARWSFVREGMTMRSVGLMQEFTRGDKREARAERALREAELARSQQRQSLADTRRSAALAWLDLAYQDSMRVLLESQLRELELQLQASEAAFRAGRGVQTDILATRLAQGRAQDQLAQMQRDLEMGRSRLTRWLGEEAARPLGELPDTDRLDWDPARLDAEIAGHPVLASRERMVAMAEAEARVARENRKPDVAVEVMYGIRGPSYDNMVSLNVSMPLPWDRANRQDRELGASLSRLDAARAEQEDMRRAYRAEVQEALASWRNARARRERYDLELIPLASAQVDAALASYRAGTGMLERALEARRMAIETRMERQRTALEAARAWAQLNFLNPRVDDSTRQGAR